MPLPVLSAVKIAASVAKSAKKKKQTPKMQVTKVMDMEMDDGGEVAPKKRRGRPKKLKTLAEVEADINLREFQKSQKKLNAAKLMNIYDAESGQSLLYSMTPDSYEPYLVEKSCQSLQ